MMNSRHDPLNLVICGVGGQGNILLSRMVGRILTGKEYLVTIGETFGAAQRGGSVFSSLRISKRKHYGPLTQEGQAHVILSLEPLEALRVLTTFGNPDVITITNTEAIYPVGVLAKKFDYPDMEKLKAAIRELSRTSLFLNATALAMELKSPIVSNIVMLGALAGTKSIPISIEDVEEEIKKSFPASKVDLNLQAMRMGVESL